MSDPTERSRREACYPLGAGKRNEVRSRTGFRLGDLTIGMVRRGELRGEDFAIHPDTLRMQATFAQEAGFPQLAANLRRAAELAAMPDEKVLSVYEALRPYRLTEAQLLTLADELARDYGAEETATYVREAAAAYARRGTA